MPSTSRSAERKGTFRGSSFKEAAGPDDAPDPPHHRTIIAVDVEGSTAMTNPTKARIRETMYDILESALRLGGILERHRDPLVDRGDGVLALVHPVNQAPKIRLLNRVIPALGEMLAEHDARPACARLRLRAAVHAGEVHYDRRGCFGEALDVTFRLLDAPELKAAFRAAPAPLILVVSDDIYRSLIRHGYDGIDASAFEPLVRTQIAGQAHIGWTWLPEPGRVDRSTDVRGRSHQTIAAPVVGAGCAEWSTGGSELRIGVDLGYG